MTKWIRRDTLIVCVFFVACMVIGSRYYTAFVQAGQRPQFGQEHFGAAVMFACGRGFADPAHDPVAALQAFLLEKQDAFSCAALPPEMHLGPPSFTQGLYRYLMMAIGMSWRLSGVSWSGLHVYAGLMFGLTAALTYALFRLVLSRPVAIVLAVVSAISSIHLVNLPHLRDYSKAPFLVALLLIVGLLVILPAAKQRVLLLSAAAGLLLGIGLGFRNDMLIGIPPVIAALLLFLPGGLRANWPLKAAAVAVFAAVFTLSAVPILRAYSSGSNTGHVALLGMMTPFDPALGVQGSLYEWGYQYSDGLAALTVEDYWVRTHGHAPAAFSQEYDRAMLEYLLLIARHWPADMLLRSYGAILKVLEMPFDPRTYAPTVPWGISSRPLTIFYGVLAQLASLRTASLFIVAAAVVIGSLQSIRLTLCLLLVCVYFAGYPVVQFQTRHVFHLQFIGLVALGIVVDQAVRWGTAVWRTRERETAASGAAWHRPAFHSVLFLAALVAAVMAPLTVLRAYQQRHVRGLLQGYVVAPKSPLTLSETVAPDGTVLLRASQLDRQDTPDCAQDEPPGSPRCAWPAAQYVVLTLDQAGCNLAATPVAFRFRATRLDGGNDFSYQTVISLITPGRRDLFFPVYYVNGMRFDGIELPQDARPCVAATSIVADLARTPMLLVLQLPPDWRNATLYQTLAKWETRSTGEHVLPPVQRMPSDLLVSRAVLDGPLQPAEIVSPGELAQAEAGRLEAIRGVPDSPTAFIVGVGERALTRRARFVLEGDIRSGGLVVGYQHNQQWDSLLNLRDRGHFLAVLAPPAEGFYSIAIGSALPRAAPGQFSLARWLKRDREDGRIDVAIQRAGWTGVETPGPEGRRPPPPLYRMPADLSVPPSLFDAELQAPEITYKTDVAKLESGRLVAFSGAPESPTGYLLGVGERPLGTQARFVVEGEARRGGIAIGYQQDGRWAGSVNVMGPGRFLAVLAPPAAGIYSVMIANAAGAAAKPPFDTRTDITIRRAGWIGADTPGRASPPPLYRLPADLKVSADIFAGELQAPDIDKKADVAKLVSGRLVSLNGVPESASASLFGVRERSIGAKARFVVEGEVRRGGIAIGYQHEGRWAGSVNIVSAGRFLAVLAPPAPGLYSAVIVNAADAVAASSAGHGIDVVIHRAGWMEVK